jgi:FdhD protein
VESAVSAARAETGVAILRYGTGDGVGATDTVATEEPLEIRVAWTVGAIRKREAISITMRTPGHDFELAAGFLYAEGIVTGGSDIERVEYCREPMSPAERCNTVVVNLRPGLKPDLGRQKRHFTTTSACGVCGKASLSALAISGCSPLSVGGTVTPEVIRGLPALLRDAQPSFGASGGVHATGLFLRDGTQVDLREDVGRHNAFDKLVGARLLNLGAPNLEDHVVVLSGRASFELLQKAVMARAPIVVALGAPSSLAVQMARTFNITLTGFTKASGFNVYSAEERIRA